MILMVKKGATFVSPEMHDQAQAGEAFAQAAKDCKVPKPKKQPQPRVPRGGSKGRTRLF